MDNETIKQALFKPATIFKTGGAWGIPNNMRDRLEIHLIHRFFSNDSILIAQLIQQ